MSIAHNKLNGRSLYVELLTLICEGGRTWTHRQLVTHLEQRYPDTLTDDTRTGRALYNRVARAAHALHQDGRVQRRADTTATHTTIYSYGPAPTPGSHP